MNINMSSIWIYSTISVGVISVISLIGIFLLSIAMDKLRKVLFLILSFSAGALIGDAFIHLLPELVGQQGFHLGVSMAIISGIAFFFIVEKIIHWRHCHHVTLDNHIHPYAKMSLFGDAVHNTVDGVVIGASYIISVPVGIATTVAVLLHEVPQEISDFGILIQGGYTKKKALWLNFLVSLTSIIGVVVALLIGKYITGISSFLIAFSAGAFIYIAAADLIPELHKEVKVSKSIAQFVMFLLGIAVMMLLLLLD
jgi:zinc and cadmium transporter